MTDARDPQDQAEALDDDKLGGALPPEEPLGVDEPEVTPLGEATSESFEQRDARHQVAAEGQPPVVQPYQGPEEDVLDDEAQAVAAAAIGTTDHEADGVPPAAEEAALHLEAEPGG